MKTFPFLAILFPFTAAQEEEVLALDLQEAQTPRAASKLIYDHIIIKFDSACSEHQDVNLGEYIQNQLKEQQRESTQTTDNKAAGFASLNYNKSTHTQSQQAQPKPKSLPDPDAFKSVFNQHFNDARAINGVHSLQPVLLDKDKQDEHRRRLGDINSEEREEQILSALHLLAALQLIGPEHVSELLTLEKRGNWRDALALVKAHAQVEVKDSYLSNLEARFKAKQTATLVRNASKATADAADSTAPAADAGDSTAPAAEAADSTATAAEAGVKQVQNEAAWMSHQALSVVTETETLSGLGIRLIRNPLLGSDLLSLAALLPCGAFTPEADRTKEALGQIEPPTAGTPLKRKKIRVMREDNVTVQPVGTTEGGGGGKVSSTFQAVEKKFLGLFKEVQSAAPTTQSYTLVVPNDRYFSNQWYLRGPSQSQPYGGQVIDGWSSMLREQFLNSSAANSSLTKVALEFANLADVPYGMTVAVLDSGCSRNQDLVNQFWRNTHTPGCTQDSFVGDSEAPADGAGVAGDCVGYDFGNNKPDPTDEVETRIHGSSTSGLIAAEANNKIDISGVCPHCQIMCLKIYDTEQGKITMSSVLRALNYVAEKGIKISNHSYGGFGSSEAEFLAHRTLGLLGHLSICSSGNNGCDLDLEKGTNACLSDSGEWLGPFTPASYDLPNIISVGGTTESGDMAWFSNYGSESVDIFAPGSDIITIYGKDKLASVKGTSFSAPIVTGMAAVLWSYYPEMTAEEVKELILSSGVHVDSLTGKGKTSRIASLARMLGAEGIVALRDGVPVTFLYSTWLLLPMLLIVILS